MCYYLSVVLLDFLGYNCLPCISCNTWIVSYWFQRCCSFSFMANFSVKGGVKLVQENVNPRKCSVCMLIHSFSLYIVGVT